MLNKYKKLKHYYNKRLKILYKHKFKSLQNSVEYLITILMVLRDSLILKTEYELLEQSKELSDLCLIIEEYEAYNNCINKYYEQVNNAIIRKNTEESAEDVAQKYAKEKLIHLNNIITLFKTNIDTWIGLYGNTI